MGGESKRTTTTNNSSRKKESSSSSSAAAADNNNNNNNINIITSSTPSTIIPTTTTTPTTTITPRYLRTKLAVPPHSNPNPNPQQQQSSSSSLSPLHNNINNLHNLKKQLKDVEISVPIVYGSAAFWLGKKASEFQSHKWTVYVRGATNEDLSAVVKKAVFQLHASFNTPMRVLESPPFEVSESGWGEFEIAITLHFHSDVSDKPLHLFHHLKLYPEEESGPMTMKKPVVVESYDEIVFTEPSEGFFSRVQNHPALTVPRLPPGFSLPPPVEDSEKRKRGDSKDNPLNQWFTNFSEADELLKLAAARQQVQTHIARLRRQLNVMEGQQQLKNSPDM